MAWHGICRGFLEAWTGRSAVDRSASYYMEKCVADGFEAEAEQIMSQEGFFAHLPPMKGIALLLFRIPTSRKCHLCQQERWRPCGKWSRMDSLCCWSLRR